VPLISTRPMRFTLGTRVKWSVPSGRVTAVICEDFVDSWSGVVAPRGRDHRMEDNNIPTRG
jgi:hypothetical protein